MDSSGNLTVDENFLQQLTSIVDANLCNEHFGAKELAADIGLSRSQLHRKMHLLTGKSTTQFIREYRLEKAYDMLKQEAREAVELPLTHFEL